MSTDIRDNGIIPASRQLLSVDIEENVQYDRANGQHMEFAAAFLDLRDPLLMFAQYEPSDEEGYPSTSIQLSMEEARLLRDLLLRPAVAAILDESAEDRLERAPGISKAELDWLAAQEEQGR